MRRHSVPRKKRDTSFRELARKVRQQQQQQARKRAAAKLVCTLE